MQQGAPAVPVAAAVTATPAPTAEPISTPDPNATVSPVLRSRTLTILLTPCSCIVTP